MITRRQTLQLGVVLSICVISSAILWNTGAVSTAVKEIQKQILKTVFLRRYCDLCSTNITRNRTTVLYEYKHPNVVYYVKFSEPEISQMSITFQEYVSIISVDRFYKPDKIVILCNVINFSGLYWDKLQGIATPIELRHTERVQFIGIYNKSPGYITHEADFVKVNTCYKEGGIYMDFDVVILNGTKVREMQKKSEIVFGRDDAECTRTCAGFFSCVPNSLFVKNWLDSYEKDYQRYSWLYNAGEADNL